MLDAEAIIEQVHAGTAPENWQVYHAPFKWSNCWAEILVFAFFIFFIVTNFPEWIKAYSRDSLLEQIAIPIFMILIVVGGAGQVRKIVEKRDNLPSWMLVITNSGIVQYMGGEPRKAFVASFSDVRINTLGGTRAFWVRQKGILSDWRPNRAFGTYQELFAHIHAAFDAYSLRLHEVEVS